MNTTYKLLNIKYEKYMKGTERNFSQQILESSILGAVTGANSLGILSRLRVTKMLQIQNISTEIT